MSGYERQYMEEVGTVNEYRVSLDGFRKWLSVGYRCSYFKDDLRQAKGDLFYIATDYSIPVVMVKFFKKVWGI